MTRERWLLALLVCVAIAGALAIAWVRHELERRKRARLFAVAMADAPLAAAASAQSSLQRVHGQLRYIGPLGPICAACGQLRGAEDPVVSQSPFAGYVMHEHPSNAEHVSRRTRRRIQLRSCVRCTTVYTEPF